MDSKVYVKITSILLIFLGVITSISMVSIVNSEKVKKDDRVYVEGTIYSLVEDKNENTHEVYVSYYVGEEEYVNMLEYYSEDMKEGQKIKIYYDKNNVKKISCDSIDKYNIIYYFIGPLLIFIGLFMRIVTKLSDILEERKERKEQEKEKEEKNA